MGTRGDFYVLGLKQLLWPDPVCLPNEFSLFRLQFHPHYENSLPLQMGWEARAAPPLTHSVIGPHTMPRVISIWVRSI